MKFYPVADSGYYSSRPLSDGNEERRTSEELDSSVNLTCTSAEIVEDDETKDVFLEPLKCRPQFTRRSHIKRSQSSPSASAKETWLRKNRTTSVSKENAPSVPIRFESLLTPTPLLTPMKTFSKLCASKTGTVYPCGICLGENGSFIISDAKNHCLRIIASNGKFIGAIGKEGKGSGEFEDPCAVITNEKAQIFVCQREKSTYSKAYIWWEVHTEV